MIGNEPLKQMRLKGIKPQAVWVLDYDCQISRDWHSPRTLSGQPMQKHLPSISIEPLDRIGALDLRFLVGLEVHASSGDESRAKALFEACKKSGAAIVVGCHTQDEKHYTEQTGWVEVYRRE